MTVWTYEETWDTNDAVLNGLVFWVLTLTIIVFLVELLG